jgi:hypothetical protein
VENMADGKSKFTGSVFLLLWILANTIGWTFITAINIIPFLNIVLIFTVGLAVSIAQYWVLTRFIGIEQMWIWVSLLVYGVFLLAVWIFSPSELLMFLIEIVTFGGLGYFQKNVLQFYVKNPKNWMVLNSLAALSATIVGFFVSNSLASEMHPSPLLFWTPFGLVYGIITGFSLILLVQIPNADVNQ